MRFMYEKELESLSDDLIKMARLVERSLENVIDAFKTKDQILCKEIIKNDRLINDMERQIESRVFGIILREQPVASDLRLVTSALKIVTDLERIGDQCADIADLIIHLDEQYSYKSLQHIPLMAKKTKLMVREAVEAFVRKDLQLAYMVKNMDDEIDGLFQEVKYEVSQILKEEYEYADSCLNFLMIAKYLERIGDHADNICEWVEFHLTGEVNHHKMI